MVPRRVIFLDFDGVLAPIRRWDRYGDLDPACVRVLNDIVHRADMRCFNFLDSENNRIELTQH